jgi:MtN3 and saliva related transmembrane protein
MYGLMIGSRNVVMWNLIAITVNFFTVAAYFYFASVRARGPQ